MITLIWIVEFENFIIFIGYQLLLSLSNIWLSSNSKNWVSKRRLKQFQIQITSEITSKSECLGMADPFTNPFRDISKLITKLFWLKPQAKLNPIQSSSSKHFLSFGILYQLSLKSLIEGWHRTTGNACTVQWIASISMFHFWLTIRFTIAMVSWLAIRFHKDIFRHQCLLNIYSPPTNPLTLFSLDLHQVFQSFSLTYLNE